RFLRGGVEEHRAVLDDGGVEEAEAGKGGHRAGRFAAGDEEKPRPGLAAAPQGRERGVVHDAVVGDGAVVVRGQGVESHGASVVETRRRWNCKRRAITPLAASRSRTRGLHTWLLTDVPLGLHAAP